MNKKLNSGGEGAEKTPELELVKQPEQAENQRSAEYNDLYREMGEAKVLGSEAAMVGIMNNDGCQELIQIYGQENFIKAYKETSADWGNLSVYEIIKKLEPDREKRQELYPKMKELIGENEVKFNQENAKALKSGDEVYEKRQGIYGQSFSGEKNLRQTHVEFFETIDKVPEAISKILLKLKNTSKIMTANLSAGRGLILNGEQELALLEKSITEAGGDLFIAHSELLKQAKEKLDVLGEKTRELMAKIQAEVDSISGQIQEETDRNIQGILTDIAALNEKKMGTAEMNRIMGTALKTAEKEIKDLAESGQKRIENMTKSQQELLNELSGVLNFSTRGY